MTEHITVSRELLRQVLEPIERATETAMHQTLVARIPESGFFGGIAQDLNWAATELRAALEKPAVEPVAWRLKDEEASDRYGKPIHVYYDCADIRLDHPDASKLTNMLEPLYTAPQAQQPAVEPYGWHVTGSNELLRGEYAQSDAESDVKRYGGTARAVALFTAPPPPADVPLLTSAEVVKCALCSPHSPTENNWLLAFARAIEQSVRQKAGLK